VARFVAPADARVFLGRLTRLDRDAVVRLRPTGAGRTALWARLPWGVLVTREVAVAVPGDVTVGAAALLAAEEAMPPPRDHEWRWPLPRAAGVVVEEVPARRLREVAAAAAGTLREVSVAGLGGRPVGVRVLREALLDHVAIVVETGTGPAPARPLAAGERAPEERGPGEPGAGEPGAGRVEVPQRLVQAVVRMGFLGPADPPAGEPAEESVRVRRSDRWVGLAARYGTAWLPPPAGPLTVRPFRPPAS
jgi:hypothetical protein